MTIDKLGFTVNTGEEIKASDINAIYDKFDGSGELIDTINDLQSGAVGGGDTNGIVSKPTISGPSAAKYSTTVTLTVSGSETSFDGESIDYYEWELPDGSFKNGTSIDYTMPDNSHVGETVTIKCRAYDTLGNKSAADEHDIEVTSNAPPVIDSIDWSTDPPHSDVVANYDVTINAHDPESDPISYNVTCDDPNVTINQDGSDPSLFHITYPDYSSDTTVTYTFEVSDSTGSNSETQGVLVRDGLPIGDVGVFGGGRDSGSSLVSNTDCITISSPGNASDFGNLTTSRYGLVATSNGTNDRGVFGGGYDNVTVFATIDYITISSPGNASGFGGLIIARFYLAATSNGTNDRGVFGGGRDSGSNPVNTIDYITISSPGNANDFGDLTVARYGLAATSNGTNDRGVFGGGYNGPANTIDYITISSPGNATDFGDLTLARGALAATSNGTNDRGVFGGGGDTTYHFNTIDYITIASPGNATDFGDLGTVKDRLAATSNGTSDRGVFGGGYNGGSYIISIEYITISSLGNASLFGDLTVARYWLAATSNA